MKIEYICTRCNKPDYFEQTEGYGIELLPQINDKLVCKQCQNDMEHLVKEVVKKTKEEFFPVHPHTNETKTEEKKSDSLENW